MTQKALSISWLLSPSFIWPFLRTPPLRNGEIALQPRFQHERGMMGKRKEKKRLESYLTFPANLSQISIVICKLQMKAIHQPLTHCWCECPEGALNLCCKCILCWSRFIATFNDLASDHQTLQPLSAINNYEWNNYLSHHSGAVLEKCAPLGGSVSCIREKKQAAQNVRAGGDLSKDRDSGMCALAGQISLIGESETDCCRARRATPDFI